MFDKMKIIWTKCSNPYILDDKNKKEVNIEEEDGGLMSLSQSPISMSSDSFKVLEKKFNLWYIDTNFWITPSIAQSIELAPGVDLFRIESAYKILIGIGKLFSQEKVAEYILNNVNTVVHGSRETGTGKKFLFGSTYITNQNDKSNR